MNIRRRWLPIFLAMVLAVFAANTFAVTQPQTTIETTASSVHAVHHRRDHDCRPDGWLAGCCAFDLCCCFISAVQNANFSVHGRNILFPADGHSWHPLAMRPLVPPPKSA